MQLDGRRMLIIGAGGAFGRLISEALIERGVEVIGTARNNESAPNLPEQLSQKLLLDLESQVSIGALVDYLNSADIQIDGIINTAGSVGFGSIAETTIEDSRRLMQINHFGPSQVIAGLMPQLAKSTNEPFVLSITGVVAEKVFSGMAAYTTSKTAHSTWLKALALEARRQKIRVIDTRPGHTETGLATRPLFGTAPAFAQGMGPQHVVDVIINAIENGITELSSDSFNA
jgi:cyclic-di-GMP-binding biofilm dispersal mediator protein